MHTRTYCDLKHKTTGTFECSGCVDKKRSEIIVIKDKLLLAGRSDGLHDYHKCFGVEPVKCHRASAEP